MQMANERVMKRYDTSRRQRFVDDEAGTLAALPAQPFELTYRRRLKAQRNNHIYLARDLTNNSLSHTANNETAVNSKKTTGCGKSYLACALGQAACDHGYRVLYLNMQKLNLRAKIAHAEGQSVKFFDMIRRKHLIIIDDFGLVTLATQQRMDLMEVIEDRHGRAATIIASQLPVAKWFDVIGENTIADAILDRLVHTSHRIELKGESMRKKM